MKIVILLLVLLAAGCAKKDIGQHCKSNDECVSAHCGEATGFSTTCYDPKVEQQKMDALEKAADEAARASEERRRNQHHQGTFTKMISGHPVVYTGSLNGDDQPDGPGEFKWPGGMRHVGEFKDGDMVQGAAYIGSEFFSTITPESLRQARARAGQ